MAIGVLSVCERRTGGLLHAFYPFLAAILTGVRLRPKDRPCYDMRSGSISGTESEDG